jgi:hypothetical protein
MLKVNYVRKVVQESERDLEIFSLLAVSPMVHFDNGLPLGFSFTSKSPVH